MVFPRIGIGDGSQKLIDWGVVALVFSAPFLLGAVHPTLKKIYCTLLFFLFAGWLFKKFSDDKSTTPLLPLWRPAALFFGFLLFQLLPLPQRLLALVSPQSHHYKVALPASLGIAVDGWQAISLTAGQTLDSLLLYFCYFALFIFFCNRLRHKSFSRLASRALLFSALLISVLAICQKLSAANAVFWLWPTPYTFYGTFINPNHCAAWLGSAAFFLYFFSLGKAVRAKRFFIAGVVTLASLALFYSLSRGAMLSFLLVGVLLVSVLFRQRMLHGPGGKHAILVTLLILALGGAILGWLGWRGVPQELATLGQTDLSLSSRFVIWRDSLHLFAQFPLFGSGLGSFEMIYPTAQTLATAKRVVFAENDYVQLLVETGLCGFALAAFCFFQLIRVCIARLRRGMKRRKAWGAMFALLFLALHSLTNFNLAIPAIGFLGTLFAAYAFRRLKDDERETSTQ